MKTEKEIKAQIKGMLDWSVENNRALFDGEKIYIDALKWVIGEN